MSSGGRTPFPIGTAVYKNFPPHGWFSGEITYYDGKRYSIVYTDGDNETATHDKVARWVQDAINRERGATNRDPDRPRKGKKSSKRPAVPMVTKSSLSKQPKRTKRSISSAPKREVKQTTREAEASPKQPPLSSTKNKDGKGESKPKAAVKLPSFLMPDKAMKANGKESAGEEGTDSAATMGKTEIAKEGELKQEATPTITTAIDRNALRCDNEKLNPEPKAKSPPTLDPENATDIAARSCPRMAKTGTAAEEKLNPEAITPLLPSTAEIDPKNFEGKTATAAKEKSEISLPAATAFDPKSASRSDKSKPENEAEEKQIMPETTVISLPNYPHNAVDSASRLEWSMRNRAKPMEASTTNLQTEVLPGSAAQPEAGERRLGSCIIQ